MIPNMRVLTGADTYRLQAKLRQYKAAFAKKYPDGSIETIEPKQPFKDLQTAVFTQNLFAGKRLIITDEYWDSELFDTAKKTKFFEDLPSMDGHVTLFVVQRKMDKRLKLTKYLTSGIAEVESFPLLKEHNMADWCMRNAPTWGGSIHLPEARYLVDRCGGNMWKIASELQKLCTATDERLTKELIQELTPPTPQAEIWDFLAAFSARKPKKALHHFQTLLSMGQSPHQILALMMREIRIHALIHAAIKQNIPDRGMGKALGINPYVIKKTLPLTRKFSAADIRNLYKALANIDTQIKTGGVSMTGGDDTELQLVIEQQIVYIGA